MEAAAAPRPITARAKDWFMWRAGPAISKLGETLGVDALVYNPFLYYQFNELARRNAPGVIGVITAQFPQAQTFIDVGCGAGMFAAQLGRVGKSAMACEYSPHGRAYAAKNGVQARPFDLTTKPPTDITERFDVAYCFEIAEHMPPDLGLNLVDFLIEKGRTIVFTAAQPGQEGTGHINEQPREYWIERFVKAGATYDEAATKALSEAFAAAKVSHWFPDNVSVFRTEA